MGRSSTLPPETAGAEGVAPNSPTLGLIKGSGRPLLVHGQAGTAAWLANIKSCRKGKDDGNHGKQGGLDTIHRGGFQ